MNRLSIQAGELCDGNACNCRRCGLDLNSNNTEWQERLEINFRAGYGSVFGDENIVRSTLCQNCVKTVLGQWLQILQDDEDHRVREGKPAGAFQPYQIKEE